MGFIPSLQQGGHFFPPLVQISTPIGTLQKKCELLPCVGLALLTRPTLVYHLE